MLKTSLHFHREDFFLTFDKPLEKLFGCSLQVGLNERKQLFGFLRDKVSLNVRILENVLTDRHELDRINEKFCRTLLLFVFLEQWNHSLVQLQQHLESFAVMEVSRIKMHVSFFVCWLVIFFVIHALFVAIARVEAARPRAVLRPRAFAEPAELIAAVMAGHVHAALVLLDRNVAFWTAFRVVGNPNHVLLFIRIERLPRSKVLARCWKMPGFVAVETLQIATTTNCFRKSIERELVIQNVWTRTRIDAPMEMTLKGNNFFR